MKIFTTLFILLFITLTANANNDSSLLNTQDNCTQMSEPCAPIDLCAEACDPIED